MGAVKQMVIENQDLKNQIQDQEAYIAYLHTYVADISVGAIAVEDAWPLSYNDFRSSVLTPKKIMEETKWI